MEDNRKQLQCSACGSTNIKSAWTAESISVPSAEPETVSASEDTCLDCGMVGDFAGRNDAIIGAALKRAESRAVENNLQFLSSVGLTMAYTERALGLPQRTMMRWKTGEHSAAATALLQMIRTYPWLLQVAEHRYDRKYAQTTVLEQAAVVIHSALESIVGASPKEMGTSGARVTVIWYAHSQGMKVSPYVPQSDLVNTSSVGMLHAVG